MSLSQRIRAVEAARGATPVAPVEPSLVLVVGDSPQHGQHASREVRSPFVRLALEGRLPASTLLPLRGDDCE